MAIRTIAAAGPCISQRGREAWIGSENSFGGSSSDPYHVNCTRRLLLARRLRLRWGRPYRVTFPATARPGTFVARHTLKA
jgi:hypothetical protein